MKAATQDKHHFVSDTQIRRIIDAANLSPSGDNCQPWRFGWNGVQLSISHVEERAAHALNLGNLVSAFTLGFVVESIRIAASAESLSVSVQYPRLFSSSDPWATITFEHSRRGPDEFAETLKIRSTDRRLYHGGDMPGIDFLRIVKNDLFPSSQVRFCACSDELNRYLSDCETFVWTHKPAHRDLMRWLRFTKRDVALSRDGMSWQSLGVNFVQSLVLRLCKNFAVQRAINDIGFLRFLKLHTRAQLRSSAAVGCITVRRPTFSNLIEAGHLGIRTWLKLNQMGYGLQPLASGSIFVFYRAAACLNDKELPQSFVAQVERGNGLLRRHFGIPSSEIPLWAFRTGISSPLPEKLGTLRLKLERIAFFDND